MFASSRVMDSMLYGGDRGKVIYTITSKPTEICKSIGSELMRGVTIFDVTGGYTGESRKMLMCSLRPFEVSSFYALVERYDPKAFIMVTEAGEIIGEGFKKFS